MDYGEVVPDSWAVINDQDVVTRGGKFGIYKRCGHRVLINARGDMLVRHFLGIPASGCRHGHKGMEQKHMGRRASGQRVQAEG